MNIFAALSQGKGRLNEENLSAMLGFLLAPNQTHGLGDVFLRQFLGAAAIQCGDETRFDDVLARKTPINADVLLEETYSLPGEKSRTVDIEIRIYADALHNTDLPTELHRIAIENKIKHQAADKSQLKEEFMGISGDLEGEGTANVTMLFLTPPGKHVKLREEFEALEPVMLGTHKKGWLHWHDEDVAYPGITHLIRAILDSEAQAHINPISSYTRHTLKAFAYHIEDAIMSTDSRGSTETGEIIRWVDVELSDGRYRIERYENSTIRVFNLGTEEYQTAKPLLRQVIKEKSLDIDLMYAPEREKNTRTLGREIIQALGNR